MVLESCRLLVREIVLSSNISPKDRVYWGQVRCVESVLTEFAKSRLKLWCLIHTSIISRSVCARAGAHGDGFR